MVFDYFLDESVIHVESLVPMCRGRVSTALAALQSRCFRHASSLLDSKSHRIISKIVVRSLISAILLLQKHKQTNSLPVVRTVKTATARGGSQRAVCELLVGGCREASRESPETPQKSIIRAETEWEIRLTTIRTTTAKFLQRTLRLNA